MHGFTACDNSIYVIGTRCEPCRPSRSRHTSVTPQWSHIVANSPARVPLGHAEEKPDPLPFLIAFECDYKDVHALQACSFASPAGSNLRARLWWDIFFLFRSIICEPPQDYSLHVITLRGVFSARLKPKVLVSRRRVGRLFLGTLRLSEVVKGRICLNRENMTYSTLVLLKCLRCSASHACWQPRLIAPRTKKPAAHAGCHQRTEFINNHVVSFEI